MTNRLKVILVVGAIAIALAYFLTRTPGDDATSASDAAYEKQLEELRKKQKTNSSSSDKRESIYSSLNKPSTASTPGENLPPGQTSLSSGPQLSDHLKQQMNSMTSSFQSLGQIIPSNQQVPEQVSEATETQSRISYLQTMPVGIIEATRRPTAVSMARQDAGREDPFAELGAVPPFPRSNTSKASSDGSIALGKLPPPHLGSGPEGMPPPPPGMTDLPPPPPPGGELTPPPGISLEELPPPPEKPLLMKKLKLNGIVGDRIILTFRDKRYQKRNGYKKYITLAQGQQFDSVTLVAVENDKAVLEEDGRQTTVHLDAIR